MKKLEQLKADYERLGLSDKETKWLFSRIEQLEAAIESHMINVPTVMTQRNNNNLHFILIGRLKNALENE
jgi:hypothetical protein